MKIGMDSPFNASAGLQVNNRQYTMYAIEALENQGLCTVAALPFSIRILLENLLRHCNSPGVLEEDVINLASWQPVMPSPGSIPFMPGRVVMQDFTGVPALVDLAALRSAAARHGTDPDAIHPFIPADLIIDHSVQVDCFGSQEAYACNVEMEMKRNRERYSMLHWGQQSFTNFRVVPPGTGIVHQVNLEHLASVVQSKQDNNALLAYPDTVLGTDSHTTMINGLGVLGWGVGGIEAEAVLLGQPYSMQIPRVVGVKLSGRLPGECTATDLVLTITRFLRSKGVVGCFVEFFGPGTTRLSLPDRATIANMAPEYGATMGFFPVDSETINYLRLSGRSEGQIRLVEQYCRKQQLFMSAEKPEPEYSEVYTVDLAEVVPCLAGPRKPQERIPLPEMKDTFISHFPDANTDADDTVGSCWNDEGGASTLSSACGEDTGGQSAAKNGIIELAGEKVRLRDGSVVIAAITSCTNTSNPSVMIGAGLLARKAADLGLRSKPWVKTSMAPGSMVVSKYLEASGLLSSLETLGFNVVGYGCTTCIGNSGPLQKDMAAVIAEKKLIVAAVLSGNRNFEARIHPLVHANYLCSPMLVVAYALAGTVAFDFSREPLGTDSDDEPVYLRDIQPTPEEIEAVMASTLTPELFTSSYKNIFTGNEQWNKLETGASSLFPWKPESTYIKEPPFFKHIKEIPEPVHNIRNARILSLFGDTITTDHISPAGAIPENSPAGSYLQGLGIEPGQFNSYGSRRGNHQVMMRGTFANIRIRNKMVEREGGYTLLMPERKEMSIYDAAMQYKETATPLVIIAGRDYGTGSSRDWAAKGTLLLGVRAVLAVSFERIHRSNLVGMGILPLQFIKATQTDALSLDGSEEITISGLGRDLIPGGQVTVMVIRENGATATSFQALVRLDNAMEVEYYRHGGILHKVLRQMIAHQ